MSKYLFINYLFRRELYRNWSRKIEKELPKRQAVYRMLMRVKDMIETTNQGIGLEDEDEVSFLFLHFL